MMATWSDFGESVGVIFEMDSSDWSNGIRYHIFDTRPDTEFKVAVNSFDPKIQF